MLSFTNPAALWLLLLAVPLILLYLLKRRRSEVIVPSVMLWKQAIEDSRAQTPFQKLRSTLLLLLQILILVLLTAILSDPQWESGYQQSQRWIMVLDCSASMQATDVKPDRFRNARDQILKLIDSLHQRDEIMLISLSSDASVLQSFSHSRDIIRFKLEALHSEDVAEDWNQLRLVLDPLLKESPRPKIVIASDFANFPDVLRSELSFDAISVGKSRNNVGISHAALRAVPDDPRSYELFYQIGNFSDEEKAVQIELRQNDTVLDAYDVSIPARQTAERNLALTVNSVSKIALQVSAPDDLSLDNDFVVLAEPRIPIPVQLATKSVFLEKALQVIPTVQMKPSAAIAIGAPDAGDQPGIFFSDAAKSDCSGPIVDWQSAHPVLRFVDAGRWQLASCRLLTPTGTAESLLETTRGTVGYTEEIGSVRRVVLGFQPEQSNIVLLAGFPIFLQNAITWIADGLSQPLPDRTGGRYLQEGPIEMKEKKGFLNFVHAQESNITPSVPNQRSIATGNVVLRRQDVSFWFLILLIAIIMFEWWAFHRRLES